MSEPNVNPDPLASSRARDAQLAELKQQAVQVAADAQDSAASAHRYAVPRETAEAWADFWIRHGAHVMPLRKDGSKKPVNSGWPDARAMTRDDIATWLTQGGGIGINLGKTGWAVLDADNVKATELFCSAGLVRTVITANAQVPDHPKGKTGGGQFILRAPVGIDPDTLHSRPFELPCGAKGDLLGGRRYIVVPPTRLDEAGGRSYMPDPEGIWVTGAVMQHVGPWAVDPDAVGNIGALEPLRGLLGPKQPHERVYDEAGEWRTPRQQQIDEVPWERVFDCAEGQKFTADSTDSCGCDVYAYAGQTSGTGRGLTAHDGCSWGWYGATWSGTARAHYDLPQTTDRLRIAARLRGFEPGGAEEVALGRAWGVEFGGLTSFADDLDRMADEYEDFADDPEQCSGAIVVPDPTEVPERVAVSTVNAKGEPVESVTWRTTRWVAYPASTEVWLVEAAKCRAAAREMRGGQAAAPMEQGTETMVAGPVVGVLPASPIQPTPADSTPADPGPLDVETVEQTTAASPASSELASDDAIEGEFVDGTATEIRAKEVFEALRGKIVVIEDLMCDLTPGLKRAYDYAESEGVFFHGFLGGLFPRLLQDVPPNVVMPPRNNKLDSKARGSGVNAYGLAVAPSSAGKGETQKAVNACVGVADGVVTSKAGTAEAWAKRLRGRSGGEDYIKATSLLVAIDEVVRFTKELDRNGSALAGFIASTWTGFGDGQDTSDEKNAAILPDHGSRIGITVNAQPGKLAVLLAMAEQGATHRFYKCLVGIVAKEDRGPLYGCSVPAVVADQSAQPWYSTMPVGYPAVPCQQPQSARDSAGLQPAPAINKLGEGADGEKKGIPGYDNEPPIWIGLPKTAKADIEAGLDIAAERAANWWTAYQQDQDGTITGHRVQMHEMVAFCIALLDGECNVSEEHWEAARLWLAGSDLVAEAVAIYTELSGEAEAYRAGKLKGVGQAAARAADVSITNSGTRSAMQAIIQNLRKLPSCTSQPGYIKQKMSKKQVAHCEQAVAALQQQGSLVVGVDGAWTLVGDLAIAA
ncbi:bifunctional DNA primase/polymerase [Mycobacteroides chelonae]|uniref:bifunctional DNA primase/polymerase n=1 Tax=Mycobacteroides chelonae TaxID=1774 RepID=UPI0019101017|nr:bifunctional DNA primase/polymerase [Mycobacteroides chelonae]QQG95890.1 bifunctional DNA primase/polymerase [Mycobacteroides chelonae]